MDLAKHLFSTVQRIFKRRLQLKTHAKGGGRQGARRQTRAKLIEQPAQEKRKRVEFLDGIVQLHLFLKQMAGLGDRERARSGAARQGV